MTMTLYIVAVGLCLLWTLWLVQHRSGWDDIPSFRSATQFLETLPLVSVVMVVKNKNEHMTQTVYHLMQQNYPRMEIIVVNDRSSHYTGMRLDELKKWSARAPQIRIPLRVIHITHLPQDWTGENYAYYQAAEQARGRYLLFIDSEAELEEDTIYSAIDYVTREGIDHLSFIPRLSRTEHLKDMIYVRLFWWSVLRQPWKANDMLRRSDGVGFGVFNLVRKYAYEEIGTYQAFKGSANGADELGRHLKEHGYNQRVMYATEHIHMDGRSSFNHVSEIPVRVGLPELLHRPIGLMLALLLQWMVFILPLLGWIPLLWFHIGPALLLLLASILLGSTYNIILKAWGLKHFKFRMVLLPFYACLLTLQTIGAIFNGIKRRKRRNVVPSLTTNRTRLDDDR